MKKLKSNIYIYIYDIGIFLVAFCAFFPFFATLWIRRMFGRSVEITQILFHLRFPVGAEAVDTALVWHFIGVVLLPALVLSLMLAAPKATARLMVWIWGIACFVGEAVWRFVLEFVRGHSVLSRYVLVALLLMYGGHYTIKKLKIPEFIAQNVGEKPYENFYEQYYQKPSLESIALQAQDHKPRNLLIIYMESMEATFRNSEPGRYTNKARAVFPAGSLIPNLDRLATQNLSFSNLVATRGAGWTIAGLISYNCAFPQTWLPFNAGFNDSVARYFLHSATCLGDVLDTLGYEQVIFRGADGEYAGSRGFFASHAITMRDLKALESWAQGYDGWRNDWGVKDSLLFTKVRESLQERYEQSRENSDNKPFAFYVLTADTHAPGFVDKQYCQDLETSYANSLHCSDRIVGDFVEWFLQSPLAKDTTLILLGDHLTMEQNFIESGVDRRIYNAFINPTFTKPLSDEILRGATLTHFDVTTLILDSLGIETRSFGLGRNPLYGKTLVQELGTSGLYDELGKPSRVYEGFWEFDPDKAQKYNRARQ